MEKNNKSTVNILWIVVFIVWILICITPIYICNISDDDIIKQKDSIIYNMHYKDSIIYNIEYRDSIIYNIKKKESEEIEKANNCTDSAAVELFYELVAR